MSYWRLYYHVIWATKGREPFIDAAREALLLPSFQATCSDHSVRCHAIGVMLDHIHLAVSIPPKVAVSEFVKAVKGSSSHLLNHQPDSASRGTFAWQGEFGVLSFGEQSLPTVVAYVQNQLDHHTNGTLYPGLEHLDRRESPENPPHPPPSLGEAS